MRRTRRGPRAFASQLLRFSLVGASGYVVNVVVYALLLTIVGLHYELAAFGAFLVAVGNNYALNRVWTFGPSERAVRDEASRFLVVASGAFGLNAALLALMVAHTDSEVAAQIIALLVVAPVSFLSNRSWTFNKSRSDPTPTLNDESPTNQVGKERSQALVSTSAERLATNGRAGGRTTALH
jgi:putative flippase GtrA